MEPMTQPPEQKWDYLKPRVVLETASLKNMKPVQYVLPGYVPKGKLSLLVGPPKSGKSTLACAMAARITQGGSHGSWPDPTPTEPGIVVFVSREDDFHDTIEPRVSAAGANLDCVKNIEGVTNARSEVDTFDWGPEHIERLCNSVRSIGNVKLIIIDPVFQTVEGDASSNQKVQRAFERLARLAKFLDVAILGLAHVVKSAKGKDPLNRVAGPLAVGGAPRSILVTAKIQDESSEIEGSHVLVRVTTLNNALGGHAYAIEGCSVDGGNGPIETSKIVWKQSLDGTASEIIEKAERKESTEKSIEKLDKAIALLKDKLKDGPCTHSEIEKSAKDVGVSDRNLQKAKKELGIISEKQKGAGQFSPFEWRLPELSS